MKTVYCLDYVKPSSQEDILSITGNSLCIDRDLGFQEYRNAYVVPADMSQAHFHRGILAEDGNIVQQSLLFEGFEDDWGDSVDEESAIVRNETVIYLGWLEPVWGHILTDCLKKLWFLKTEACQRLLAEGAKLIAAIPWNSKALRDIFALLDIPFDSIEIIGQLTQFGNIIVPDNSFIATRDDRRYYTKEYKDVITQIFNKIPASETTGKLYFTRTGFKTGSFWNRREYGEETIVRVFKKMGYQIVRPENNSTIENLTLLRNCESFASTEGSISHNVLFCKPGTPVVIARKVDYTNRWQLVCNEVSQVDVTYIDTHQSVISRGCLGPFYMCVTKQLEAFYGHHILHVSHYVKPSFWWYLVQNRRITKRILSLFKII